VRADDRRRRALHRDDDRFRVRHELRVRRRGRLHAAEFVLRKNVRANEGVLVALQRLVTERLERQPSEVVVLICVLARVDRDAGPRFSGVPTRAGEEREERFVGAVGVPELERALHGDRRERCLCRAIEVGRFEIEDAKDVLPVAGHFGEKGGGQKASLEACRPTRPVSEATLVNAVGGNSVEEEGCLRGELRRDSEELQLSMAMSRKAKGLDAIDLTGVGSLDPATPDEILDSEVAFRGEHRAVHAPITEPDALSALVFGAYGPLILRS
jgi:hypothetical protein